MKKKLLTIFFLMGLIAPAAYADYDDYSTPGINEGAIGSGYDDYSTPGINEGAWGSSF